MARESFSLELGTASVSARGLKAPTARAVPEENGDWMVRVEDAHNPEFWLELRLGPLDLARMTADANSEDR